MLSRHHVACVFIRDGTKYFVTDVSQICVILADVDGSTRNHALLTSIGSLAQGANIILNSASATLGDNVRSLRDVLSLARLSSELARYVRELHSAQAEHKSLNF